MFNKINSKNFCQNYLLILFSSFVLIILIAISLKPAPNNKSVIKIDASDEIAQNSGELNLLTVGDIILHDGQLLDAYNEESNTYNFDNSFKYVLPYLESADIVSGNLEGTIVPSEVGYSGYPTFLMPESILSSLKTSGFDLLTTNNDKFFNNGEDGVLYTKNKIAENNLTPIGTYLPEEQKQPCIIEKNNIRLGFIDTIVDLSTLMSESKYEDLVEYNKDYTKYLNLYDRNKIRQDIEYCKNNNTDFIIVYIHWGEEYSNVVTVEMQQIVNYLISSGADLVVGTHSHIVMPLQKVTTRDAENIENIRTGYVIYSLGNFISNQRNDNADIGVMLNFNIRKINNDTCRINKIEYIPIYTHVNISDGKNFTILPVENAETPPPEWCDYYNSERFERTWHTVTNLLNFF